MTEHEAAQRLLTVSGYDLGPFRVLEVVGECDVCTATELWSALVDAISGSSDAVIVDLSRLAFGDSACVEMVLAASSAHPLVVSGTTGIMARVFDFLDPTHTVARYPSVDSAAWSLSGLPEPWQ